jgi:homoserine O-acetyltransferase
VSQSAVVGDPFLVELRLVLGESACDGLAVDLGARQYGGGSLTRAFEDVSARTLLIAFSSDWLYPPSGSREIEDALRRLGKPVAFHLIDAPYGHDCFLLEEARQTPIIRRFLGEGP